MLISLHKYADWGLLALRLAVGIVFLTYGMAKWSLPDANTVMNILKIAEPIGGIALIIGFLTELASLGFVIIMLGAIFMKATSFGQQSFDLFGTYMVQGGGGWDFDAVLLAGAFVLFLMGAGRFSVDWMMKKA